MKISIIIPAHNEEKRIGRTLDEYCKFFKKIKKSKELKDFEILVVLNACIDRTAEIVKKAEKKFGEIKHIEFEQGGKGFAITEGFKHSIKKDFDLIGFVDADMATSPAAFNDLIRNIGDYYGIIGSRYINGAIVNPKQTLIRIFVSRIFNFLIRSLFLFNYRDTQCGAKIFKRKAIEEILKELTITMWAFDVDLLYLLRKKGLIVREYPTVWSDQKYSKIDFMKAGPRMALAIIRLRLLNSKLKFIVRMYNKLPKWMKISLLIR